MSGRTVGPEVRKLNGNGEGETQADRGAAGGRGGAGLEDGNGHFLENTVIVQEIKKNLHWQPAHPSNFAGGRPELQPRGHSAAVHGQEPD